MIAVVQRVTGSSVEIDGAVYSRISGGLLVFLGIKKGDSEASAGFIANKIVNLRIFSDDNGKMNLSIKDIGGEIMVISQFTLCTDNAKSGNRPSFTLAEDPVKAKELYDYTVRKLKNEYEGDKILTGVFSAQMKVNILNDGPVTIILEK
jgi:D-aminoacyl-tRNA deacylase